MRSLGQKSASSLPNKSSHPTRSDPHSFAIVGVGSSAGGLEAVERFLKALPATTGMAFVLVQHLDPTHESRLTEILARATSMPVAEVKDGMPVRPNRVYIIPPNTNLSLRNEILHLEPRKTTEVRHLPVDFFFHSLAAIRGNRAIGVILSGTASDGVDGMRAIKQQGGITFAQDAESAKYFGMPHSSIVAGFVDFVLPPERIAKLLARIARQPHMVLADLEDIEEGGGSTRQEAILNQIFRLLKLNYGVDFSVYKKATVHRRIKRRMVLRSIAESIDYLRYIRGNPDELKSLYQDMFVGVTEFFRDPGAFERLKKLVFPRILKNRAPDVPIRIWVPGCSTGEEVYSLAIALAESLPEKALEIPIQIFGSDINEESIKKARLGRYAGGITANVGKERLRRFFRKTEDGYEVSKAIRECCVFAKHDILNDPPFSNLDLLSCRNVLIYLAPSLHHQLFPVFQYAIKPGGFLMLGTAETVGGFSNLFEALDRKQKIYVRKASAGRVGFDYLTRRRTLPATQEPPEKPALTHRSFELQKAAADLLLLNQYAPASVLVNENMEILHFRGRTGTFLEPAPGAASLNLMKMAREGLLVGVRFALQEARKTKRQARQERLRVDTDTGERVVNVQVDPLKIPGTKERVYLVLFEDASPKLSPASGKKPAAKGKATIEDERALRIGQLKQELTATKAYLQSVIENQETSNEELKSLNEEILSSNEELQSTSEELETSNEELQSANEELITVNEELQRRNAQLDQAHNDTLNLLRSMNVTMVFLDRHLRLRQILPASDNALHLVASDIGRPLAQVRLNVEIPDLDRLLAAAIRDGKVSTLEIQDRLGRWYSLQIRPYVTSEEKVEGIVLALVDVHDLAKKTHQLADTNHRLRLAEEKFRMFVETAPDPMLLIDSKGIIKLANKQVERLFGYKKAEVEGQPQQILIPVDSHKRHEAHRAASIKNPKARLAGDGIDTFAIRKDGGRVPVEINLSPVPTPEGLEISASIRDMSNRNRFEEQRKEAAVLAERNRLARDVHDSLAQGLTGIVLQLEASEQILDKEPGEARKHIVRARDLARKSLQEARRSLLAIRPPDGNRPLLPEVLERSIDDLRRESTAKIELSVQGTAAPLPPEIRENFLRIAQEALYNAIRHGKASHITVELDYHKGAVVLRIRDNGRGFSPGTKPNQNGMGLNIMCERAAEMGGKCTIRSKPSKGTSVEVFAPLDGVFARKP